MIINLHDDVVAEFNDLQPEVSWDDQVQYYIETEKGQFEQEQSVLGGNPYLPDEDTITMGVQSQ